jgi:hypothetical protein
MVILPQQEVGKNQMMAKKSGHKAPILGHVIFC